MNITCYFVGETRLLIDFALLWLKSGNEVLGILTDDTEIISWTLNKSIPIFRDLASFEQAMKFTLPDYLLSVANPVKLPSSLTSLARQYAINYHNSLLPTYAGVNAPTWALLNQEAIHGVTWHLIDNKLDSGDIVIQKSTNISKKETSFSLSIKLYKVAIEAFEELISLISENKINPVPQNLSKRTFFSKEDLPDSCGFIDFSWPARKTVKFINALDFGKNNNPLVSAKIIINGKICLVNSVEQSGRRSNKKAGTVTIINDEYVMLATKRGVPLLIQITPIDKKKLIQLESNQAESPSKEDIREIQLCYLNEKKGEKEIISLLENFRNINFFDNITDKKRLLIRRENLCRVDVALIQKITTSNLTFLKKNILVVVIILYLIQLNNYEPFTTWLVSNDNVHSACCAELFSKMKPITIDFPARRSFEELVTVVNQLFFNDHLPNFSYEIFSRNKELDASILRKSIAVIINGKKNQFSDFFSSELTPLLQLYIDTHQNTVEVVSYQHSFSGETNSFIETLESRINILLSEIIPSKTTKISDIQSLSKEEQYQLLYQWNTLTEELEEPATLVNYFSKQVKKTPSSTALSYKLRKYSYKEVDEMSNQLAHYLIEQGLSPGKLIGITSSRKSDEVITVLAILKIGCAFVPISEDLPQQTIQNIIETSTINLVFISNNQIKEKINLSHIFYYQLGEICSLSKEKSTRPTNIVTKENDIAYVIYTSGTTGKPKGASITHRGVCNLAKHHIAFCNITKKDNILNFAPIYFDVYICELFLALFSGGTFVQEDKQNILAGKPLFNTLKKEKITVIALTPSVLTLTPSHSLPSLRIVISGGENCNQHIVKKWLTQGREFINAYGSTETAVCSTLGRLKLNEPINIGSPIHNKQVYVLDKCKHPMPVYGIGEIYISGEGIMKGYKNQPELTKKCLVQNPFNKNSVMYQSGDIGRWLPNGTLECLGRKDNQIKIRGHRVETLWIKNVLMSIEFIDDAFIKKIKNNNGVDMLAAYLFVKNSIKITQENIRSYLKSYLPSYMIPSYFIMMQSFPVTKNGKIDSALLPSPIPINKNSVRIEKKKNLTTQEKIIDILKSMLAVEEVNPKDDFFELGGNSLLISELVSNISKEFSISLKHSEILKNPTVENITSLIDSFCAIAPCYSLKDSNFTVNMSYSKVGNYESPSYLLLTGSTGLVGSYLLNELLDKTKAKIFCLVRNEISRKKISNNRVEFIKGDLTLPKLGVDASCYAMLAEKVDAIYHCAAQVNHLSSFSALKATNAESMISIINFATEKTLKKIHYISTLSVVHAKNNNNDLTLTENFPLLNVKDIAVTDGYSQSKWVSEQLLSQAVHQGLKGNIYRLAWIIDDAKCQSTNWSNDHFRRLVSGCLKLGAVPDAKMQLSYSSAKFITYFIVKASFEEAEKNHIFNCVGNQVDWREIVNIIQKNDSKISVISTEKWRGLLSKLSEKNPMYPLSSLYKEKTSFDRITQLEANLTIKHDNYTRMLAKLNINAPEASSEKLMEYLGVINTA